MASRAGRIGAIAGIFSAGVAGCLDPNLKFIEPSGGTTSQATTGSATTTTSSESTGPAPTSMPYTSGETTATTTSPPLNCGDGNVDADEECDLGPQNSDGGACTTLCKMAACGDGLVFPELEQCDEGAGNSDSGACTTGCKMAICGDSLLQMGVEECDAGPMNADDGACKSDCTAAICGDGIVYMVEEECDDGDDDPKNGCFGCAIPRSCLKLHGIAEELGVMLPNDVYTIDLDGPGGVFGGMLVGCDMQTAPGGWTVVERSPRMKPIDEPLFLPPNPPVNETDPNAAPYRMKKSAIDALLTISTEMRLGCGPDDYLVTDAVSLKAGEGLNPGCNTFVPIEYKSGKAKGVAMPMPTTLCTGLYGQWMMEPCGGTWSLDEISQMACGQLDPWPWPNISPGVNLFAVDPLTLDPGPPPIHKCHEFDAIRQVMLR